MQQIILTNSANRVTIDTAPDLGSHASRKASYPAPKIICSDFCLLVFTSCVTDRMWQK